MEEYKIQTVTETTFGIGTKPNDYVLCLIKDGSLFVYDDYIFNKTFNYEKLKNTVIRILNKEINPVKKFGYYNKWITDMRAKNKNLYKLRGEGSSYKNAVVVENAHEEYMWIGRFYPGFSLLKNTIIPNKGKYFDVLTIKTIDKQELEVYFDITEFHK